jgi:hypothetical protein
VQRWRPDVAAEVIVQRRNEKHVGFCRVLRQHLGQQRCEDQPAASAGGKVMRIQQLTWGCCAPARRAPHLLVLGQPVGKLPEGDVDGVVAKPFCAGQQGLWDRAGLRCGGLPDRGEAKPCSQASQQSVEQAAQPPSPGK